MIITIFTYNREEMLAQRLEDFKYIKTLVIDDASDYDVYKYDSTLTYSAPAHGGKKLFFKQWQTALHLLEDTEEELYIFTPDDFSNLQTDKIEEIHKQLNASGPYVVNIINDGRTIQYIDIAPEPKQIIGEKFFKVGFTDCGFFCNRATLEAIGFSIPDVPSSRFINNENISSGVGQTLTNLFYSLKIPIYLPLKSLAYHGAHPSKMHPEERLRNPLISR